MKMTVAFVTPVAGFTCIPFRYCQLTAFPPASYNPTQSPGAPGPFATVAVTVPPVAPVVALSVRLGAVVAIDPLIASSAYAALKKRAWYVPGVTGNISVSVALVTPVAGITCVPFRYCQVTALPPASYSPTQSPGAPGPFVTVAATVPPVLPVAAPKVMLGAAPVGMISMPAKFQRSESGVESLSWTAVPAFAIGLLYFCTQYVSPLTAFTH